VVHVVAGFAFQAQSLLFGGFCEGVLQGVFLSAVTFFLACVGSFACGECAAFACLVKAYSMNSVMFTFRTVRIDFFRNVHVFHYQLPNKETRFFLYFMTYKPKKAEKRP